MAFIPTHSGATADAPLMGYSYGAVLVPAERAETAEASDLRAALSGIRFTGWITPPSDGWVVVIGDPGVGVCATGRRGIIEVGEVVASQLGGTVLAVRVLGDRQLGLVAWHDGEEIVRYCSDPSAEPNADKDVLDDPVGEEGADALARACGRPDAAEQLSEVLGEALDSELTNESERLGQVARLLGLPRWIVSVGEMPISSGPAKRDLVRLRVGETGASGKALNVTVARARRRKTPPPIIDDPPTSSFSAAEMWLL